MKHRSITYRTTTLAATIATCLCVPSLAGAAVPWQIEAGIGYDSNPYRTPNTDYTDYAQAGNPLITPNVQSGFYIPLKAEAQLTGDKRTGNQISSTYKLDMNKYLSSDLSNADEYSHRLSVGKNIGEKTADRSLYAELNFGINRQTYFDRDDGLPKTTTGGSDISDRYNYISYGADLSYDNRIGSQPYTLSASVEKLDYDDPVGTTQLDHNRIEVGIDSETRFSRSDKLKYGYHYASRSYDSRHARDSAAALTTQLLEYDYHIIDLSLRNRFNDNLVSYFDYTYKQRNDGYVGYNDNVVNTFKIRSIYKTDNVRTRLALTYYTIDYGNAFNYENPLQGSKSSDALTVDLSTEFSYANYQWWAGVKAIDKNSTDLRYQYDRYQADIGISLAL